MLSPGARVAVVAPAGVFDPDRLNKGLAMASAWGLTMVPGSNLNCKMRYTAGTVEQRAADLNWALTAPDIDGVWFARGGYGTAQLLEHLNWGDVDKRLVIGFSDATALFVALSSRGRGRPIHGPVLHSLADLADKQSQDALRALIMEGDPGWLPIRPLMRCGESVCAPVVGGNLCVMTSLCGTPFQLDARDSILVIEDVGEAPYRLDRMVSQLKSSGSLDGVAAIVLGDFQGSHPPGDASWTMEEMWADLLSPLNVPVVMGLPVGHGKRNLAWQVGGMGTLTLEGLRVEAG